MILVTTLFLIGVFLSAFFSGSETGFYRITRTRLVIQGMGGDWFSRALLWLTNNPSLFVATTLIGNNAANYITSLAIVLGAQLLLGEEMLVAELVAPILIAPWLFVYGELLPKRLFFEAPNMLLRRAAPLFLLFAIIFSPLAGLLWSLGRGLERLIGQSPEKVQLALARKELQQILREGQDAGILQPSQRELAQNVFSVAAQPATSFMTSIARMPTILEGTRKTEAIRVARRNHATFLAVRDRVTRELIGYLRTIDLYLEQSKELPAPRTFMEVDEQETHSGALLKMQAERETIAKVVNHQKESLGLLTFTALIEPILAGNLESLRR